MRKIPSLSEIRDRTTLVPGERPLIDAPQLVIVVDCLFAVRADPSDRSAKIKLVLLQRQGECACPACGDDVTLAGFRRTCTDWAIRDEWSCDGCGQRFLLAEDNVC